MVGSVVSLRRPDTTGAAAPCGLGSCVLGSCTLQLWHLRPAALALLAAQGARRDSQASAASCSSRSCSRSEPGSCKNVQQHVNAQSDAAWRGRNVMPDAPQVQVAGHTIGHAANGLLRQTRARSITLEHRAHSDRCTGQSSMAQMTDMAGRHLEQKSMCPNCSLRLACNGPALKQPQRQYPFRRHFRLCPTAGSTQCSDCGSCIDHRT